MGILSRGDVQEADGIPSSPDRRSPASAFAAFRELLPAGGEDGHLVRAPQMLRIFIWAVSEKLRTTYAQILIVVDIFGIFLIFWCLTIDFPEVFGGPGDFRGAREARRNQHPSTFIEIRLDAAELRPNKQNTFTIKHQRLFQYERKSFELRF